MSKPAKKSARERLLEHCDEPFGSGLSGASGRDKRQTRRLLREAIDEEVRSAAVRGYRHAYRVENLGLSGCERLYAAIVQRPGTRGKRGAK